MNPALFLRVIVDTVCVKTEAKGLLFSLELAPDLPAAVHCDEQRLRQVLLNLLDNAVKFTDRGQISLRVQAMPGRNGASRLRFEVEDTGLGIAPDQLEASFEPFEQVGDARHSVGGTGLGLAISRQLVRLMGGNIEVESEVGRGSRFGFELELALAAARPAA
ncbi:MAG: hybrid sensor histidine kinase/response regulator, partial [Betaproteobacteria bacterium]